jgi:hypothetical protein
MAATTVTSTLVASLGSTNAEVAINPYYQVGGALRSVVDTAAFGTNNTVADIHQLCVLPSNARLASLKLFNDDLDANGSPTLAVGVGLANASQAFVDGVTPYAAGAAIGSATLLDSAITTLQAANKVGVELMSAVAVTDRGKRLWELAGLAADPGVLFVINVKVSTVSATAAAGNIGLQASYVV